MTEKNIWISCIPNDEHILSALDDAQSSSISSLTNPNKLENPTSSVVEKRTSHNTIKGYLDYVEDIYLFQSAKRGNVKGRKYFDTLQEYYAMDLGLKNACLTFRQQEHSHLMEYMIYNELIRRGDSVDVGVVEITRVIEGKHKQSQYEIEIMNSIRFPLTYREVLETYISNYGWYKQLTEDLGLLILSQSLIYDFSNLYFFCSNLLFIFALRKNTQ